MQITNCEASRGAGRIGELSVPKECRPLLVYVRRDAKWARWLLRQLDAMWLNASQQPAKGLSAAPKSDLALIADDAQIVEEDELSAATRAKLDLASALIVICSPAAAEASGIFKTVSAFKANGGGRPVAAFIVAGGSSNAERGTIPEAIYRKLSPDGKPIEGRDDYLKADVRDTGDGQELAVAKVLAWLTGVPVPDLLPLKLKMPGALDAAATGFPGVAAANGPPAQAALAQTAVNEELITAAANFVLTSLPEIRGLEGRSDALAELISQTKTLLELFGQSDAPQARFRNCLLLLEISRCYGSLGDFAGHLDYASQAGEQLDSLLSDEPNNADYLTQYAASFMEAGEANRSLAEFSEAAQCFASSVRILEDLASSSSEPAPLQRELSRILQKLAAVLREIGEESEADAKDGAALLLLRNLAQARPEDVDLQRELFEAQLRAGEACRQRGDADAGLQSDRALIPIATFLRGHAGGAEMARHLYAIHTRIGDRLRVRGDLDEALESYSAAIDLAKELHRTHGRAGRWQREIALSHNRAGNVHGMKGSFPAAEQSYRASLALAAELVKLDPANLVWRRDLALAHGRIGVVLSHQGLQKEALQVFHEGRDIIRVSQQTSENNGTLNGDLAWFENQIGIVTR